MAGTKKYKLFSAADGTKAPCAFFNSPSGCRNGDNCKFLHSTGGAQSSPAALSTTEVVSSESESSGESEAEQAPAPTPAPVAAKTEPPTASNEKPQRTKKRKSSSHEDQVFAKPHAKKDKEEKQDGDDDLFVSPEKKARTASSKSPAAAAAATATNSNTQAPLPSFSSMADRGSKKKALKKKASVKKEKKPVDFRSLKLPIASFSIPYEEGDSKAKQGEQTAPEPSSEPAPRPEAVAVNTAAENSKPQDMSKFILPESTAVGRKWKDVVAKTYEHPEFASIFSYDKYKEIGIPGDTWIKSKPFGQWCADFPQAIAIDCEMCESTDPVSGKKNHNTLCRVSIVNAEEPDEVLLDTLVKPAWPVTDYRTFVNGIKKEHLEPVQFTLRHCQAFMMALCSEETVILGHAVHNDLAAMRMEHYCVGDSALLFKATDSPTATVSLKDLAMCVLKKGMPNTHDSVNDARTALLCLDHYRENNGVVEGIVRTTSKNKSSRTSLPTSRTHHQLLVHRIPKMCKENHLSKMFQEHTSVVPETVDEIDFASRDSGRTHVNFKSPRHASLAFESLEGTGEKDKSGRMQKKVFLRNGDYVRVRKMQPERERKSS